MGHGIDAKAKNICQSKTKKTNKKTQIVLAGDNNRDTFYSITLKKIGVDVKEIIMIMTYGSLSP